MAKSKKSNKPLSKDLKLMVINENESFEVVEVPISLRRSYIDKFGVTSVTTKSELLNWLNSQNV